jgi:ubiquinone/menaquinone biosynthesis C-methylase UbiE
MTAEPEPSRRRPTTDQRATLQRTYARIAPWYDLLDLALEYRRYRALRSATFARILQQVRILDCGAGTGRNVAHYPDHARVTAFDLSLPMIARGRQRSAGIPILQADVTRLPFVDRSFEAAVATFLFCVLPDEWQQSALREIMRVVETGGRIVLLDYALSSHPIRRAWMHLWRPWIGFAYGASFTRGTAEHVARAGLRIEERRFLHSDTIELIVARKL